MRSQCVLLLLLVSCAEAAPAPQAAHVQARPAVVEPAPPAGKPQLVNEQPPPPPPPRHRARPLPAPPGEIEGEGPCESDGDCAVVNGTTCCQCSTLEVRSARHQQKPPPACGCADLSRTQMIAELTGELGPCGGPPPAAGEYRAECRAGVCVGVRR